jgi:predicted O-methyltransferase YrrM
MSPDRLPVYRSDLGHVSVKPTWGRPEFCMCSISGLPVTRYLALRSLSDAGQFRLSNLAAEQRRRENNYDFHRRKGMNVNNDLVQKIRAARRKLARDGPIRLRSAGDFERVSIGGADGDVLRDLVLAENAHTVIEIGLAYGSSALAIAEALACNGSGQQRHLIIDAYQNRFYGSGWGAIIEADIANLCLLFEERSQIVLPRLLSDRFVADIAFVDGSHIFHNVFVDLYYLRELVCPGGLVILDDCNYPSVATAVRYFQVNTGWQPEPIAMPTRLRAFRLPDPRIDPNLESFKPF